MWNFFPLKGIVTLIPSCIYEKEVLFFAKWTLDTRKQVEDNK